MTYGFAASVAVGAGAGGGGGGVTLATFLLQPASRNVVVIKAISESFIRVLLMIRLLENE